MGTRARLAVGAVVLALTATGTAVAVHAGGSAGRPAGGPGPTATATAGPGVLPAASRGPLLPAAPDVPAPTAAGLQAALGPVLAATALGPGVAAAVVDATSGAPLFDLRGGTALLPASTAKLATAVAVLTGLPPDTRLTTRVLAGPLPGDVVLVGGGDVTLAGPAAPPALPAPARLADLAAQVLAARAGAPVTRVLVDDTAWSPERAGPGWRPGYVTGGDVAPVSALSMDGGRAVPTRDDRVPDPALAATAAFAGLLHAPAVPVARGTAPAGAAQLGTVSSAPLPDLVEQMLTRSDNDLAEALAHRLALGGGAPVTFAAAAAAVRDRLAGVVPAGSVALVDGSGLSRDDRVQPAAVAALLAHVVADVGGRLGPVLSGMPVGGFDGTLVNRYRTGPAAPAAGQVRAKTGTLEGVSALAGLVRTADGRLLAFDVTAASVPVAGTLAAQAALDRVAATLAGCGCR